MISLYIQALNSVGLGVQVEGVFVKWDSRLGAVLFRPAGKHYGSRSVVFTAAPPSFGL